MEKIIRSTSFGDWKMCNRKAYYNYVCGYVIKNGVSNPDLFFGTVVHEARKIFHGEGIDKAIEYIHAQDFPPHKLKNPRIAEALIKVYSKKRKAKTICDERSFEFSIGDWTWKGRFDGICTYASKMLVDEAKTTKPFYLQTNPNDQFIAYLIGARNVFSENVAGVLLDNFDVEKVDVRFYELTYSENDIEEWLRETEFELRKFSDAIEQQVFPKNPNSCTMFGPRKRCVYHPLCTAADEETYDRIVKGLYEVDERKKQQIW